MGVLFGEAAGAYSSLDPLAEGEDTSALWEQEQEEIRRQQQAAYYGYQQSQSHFPLPATLSPGTGPTAGGAVGQQFAQPAPGTSINPNQGGFRDPVNNPANVQPGPAADPLAPLMGLYNTEIPVVSPVARAVSPVISDMIDSGGPQNYLINQGLDLTGAPDWARLSSPTGGLSAVSSQLGGPTYGEFATDMTLGRGKLGDLALLLAPKVGDVPADDIVRGLSRARGGIDNVVRGAFPEPNLAGINLGAGLPPPNQWDESVLGPLPSGPEPTRQWYTNPQAQQPGGRIDPLAPTKEGLPSPPSLVDLNAPVRNINVLEPQMYEISQLWAQNTPNAPLDSLTSTQQRTALYNAGLEPNGTAQQIAARYALADSQGIKLPLDTPPSDMPDAFDLARRGVTPQAPSSRGQPAFGPGSRGGMPGDTTFDDAVARANAVPLEDQWQVPGGQIDDTADQMRAAFEETRRQEQILTGGGSTPQLPAVETGSPSAVPGSPPPASPPPPVTPPPGGPPPTPPPSDAGRHWFDDPRFPLRPEATPPPQVPEVQQAVEDALRETPSTVRAVEPEGVRLVRDAVNRAEAELGVYSKPGAVERAVNAVANPATGRYSDSFLNEVIRRDQLLRTALEDTRTPLGDIDARLADFRETLVKQHYPGNRGRQQDALNAIEKHFADAESLRKDMAGWNRVTDSAKNTVFGLMDFGIMGQSGLAGLAQSGPQILIGMANRLALAAHSLPAMKWLPAVDLEKTYGLPRKLILQNMGLDYNTSASLVQKGAGSPLSLIPGLQGLDKRTIGGLIEKSSDLQFNTIGGWFKTMDAEGSLASNYTLKFLTELAKNPVPGGAGKTVAAGRYALSPTEALDRAKTAATNFILDPKNQREIMTKVNNDWSSAQRATTPGRQELEKQIILSPSFFRSKINRMSDLANIAKPGASETQRMLAAQAIMAQAVFVLGAYQVINDQIGIGEAVTDPFKAGFGSITLPWRNSEGERIRVSLVPQRSFQNVITRTMNAVKDGDPKAAAEAWTRYGFGSLNLFPRAVTSATGYGYDSQGRFHSPFGGERMSLAEAGKANIPVPPVAQNVISGTTTDVASQAITAGGFSTYGQSLGSEAFSERNEAASIKSQALMDGNLLRAAFPNNPEVAAQLQGQEWRALEWHEQQAIIRAMSPEQRAQLEEAEKVSAAANKQSPTALGNKIAIQQATDVKEDERRAETKAKADALMAGLMNGSLTPAAVANGSRILKDTQNEDLARIRWEGSTTYTGLPWKDKEGMERLPSQFETALQQYKSISGKLADVPDGKGGTRFDYDGLTRAQAAFLTVLGETDPATKARLDFYLQDKAERAEVEKPELFKLYDNISARTQEYWRLPTGTGEKTQWLREHPMEDALLNMIGWMPVVHSPEAARMLIQLTPGRTR